MNPDQLLKHFDRISEAPDAIAKLRQLILDLAVRGKLVEQDPNDEPASELLRRIDAARAQAVNAGEIKKEKPQTPVDDDEIPFGLPKSWKWVRIRQVTSGRGQTVPDKEFTYIDVTAIDKEVGCIKAPKVLRADEAPSRARKLVRTGDVLYSCVRPYLLNVAVVDKEITPSPIASTAFAVLNGFGLVNPAFLWIALRSPFMVGYVEGKMRGQAYPAINDADFAMLPVPLPPLPEQLRIGAKVDELMRLCDRLESAQLENEKRRSKLVVASLHGLANGASVEAFRKHAGFYLDHLPRLTARMEHIHSLQQTVLSLAVRGKLVASPTTNRVDHNLGSTETGSLTLPVHWSVKPLSQLAEAIVDCPHSTPKWTAEGRICVRTNQFHPGHLDLSTSRYVSQDTYLERIQRLQPVENDILYSREGGILGVACRVPSETRLCLGQRMMLIRAGSKMEAAFLELVLNSPLITDIAKARTTGGAAPRINVATVKAYPIPLPPLGEQRYIVAKVNELMALCDELASQITHAKNKSHRFLEAVLHAALQTSNLRELPDLAEST